jgi:Arc/MetJ family transcription regulator
MFLSRPRPSLTVVLRPANTPLTRILVYDYSVSRTNIEIDDALIRKARQLTRLRTKRAIVDRALEVLVRTESRKGMLRYYGSGIWQGDLKAARRNRV